MDELNYDYDYSQILADIEKNQQMILENQNTAVESQKELIESLEVLETITQNQEAAIEQLTIANEALTESNTVLVNFFFCFMVLMVCKFVHFLFYKVFFGGIT